MVWNPFKKAKAKVNATALGMLQKVAEKKLQNMSPQEQQKMMREAFKPENKKKMLEVMEQMKATGQITEDQYKVAKQKLG
ncbi:MAG: hypothetical protein WC022_03720 [Parcubacteria group bacterium]